ncbi:type II toxin-antitoxin system VapC family toxin [Rhizobium sp. 32-5/1]|uniref:type II toxin-antitoxin system VapC family toxin n=1 Tax=Rhizobium sp. 32-5/1 TaxID=3019602 RepID=UPI00240DA594|nr:type II toxin-antitoxin system VapC family toxin [Rhizobium sp. 32-5/1]WEZ84254.1 type II toxin-antitoxin system VapC family toxin [Rhizobium sp. 32-5/1]
MIGWLLDTNVISALINPNGAPSVKTWAKANDENTFFINILTLAEYDKGIENLPSDDVNRYRYMESRDALEQRFSGRILPVSDAVVRRWGALSGRVKRESGQAPPVIDTLLAATALEHKLFLVTRNIKDMRLSGAAVFDPWNDDVKNFPLSRK